MPSTSPKVMARPARMIPGSLLQTMPDSADDIRIHVAVQDDNGYQAEGIVRPPPAKAQVISLAWVKEEINRKLWLKGILWDFTRCTYQARDANNHRIKSIVYGRGTKVKTLVKRLCTDALLIEVVVPRILVMGDLHRMPLIHI